MLDMAGRANCRKFVTPADVVAVRSASVPALVNTDQY